MTLHRPTRRFAAATPRAALRLWLMAALAALSFGALVAGPAAAASGASGGANAAGQGGAGITAAGAELVMFDQPGCVYCLRWEAEVGPEYPLTAEGRAAPLRQINLHAALPPGVTLARRVTFTPTFVLLRDGAEVGRLEGYPGEDFFWGLLQQLLANNGIVID